MPPRPYEIQMLYGMADPIKDALVAGPAGPRLHAVRPTAAGHGVPGAPAAGEHVQRVVPAGQLHASNVPEEQLLHESRNIRISAKDAARLERRRRRCRSPADRPFHNEPLTDFSREDSRAGRCTRALATVQEGSSARLIRSSSTARRSTPSETIDVGQPVARSEVVGTLAKASDGARRHAAIAAAEARFRPGATPIRTTRADLLVKAADDHAQAALRAGRLAGLRVRQAVARGRRRRRRGDRLLRVLRPRDAPRWPRRSDATCPAKTNDYFYEPRGVARRHRAVELPAGDPDRHDRGRARHRQHGHHEAGRAVVGHRREADGDLPGGRPAAGRRQLPARRRRGDRPDAGRASRRRPWSPSPARSRRPADQPSRRPRRRRARTTSSA